MAGANNETSCPTISQLVQEKQLDPGQSTNDSWNQPYTLNCTDDEVIISSNGPDKKKGTQGRHHRAEGAPGPEQRNAVKPARKAMSMAKSKRRRSERGLTLVELLIVIALIAVLGGNDRSGIGDDSGNRLRGAAGLVVTAVRLAITRCQHDGSPVRLTFDIDANRISMEETVGAHAAREERPGGHGRSRKERVGGRRPSDGGEKDASK